jgi:hypothetical protein
LAYCRACTRTLRHIKSPNGLMPNGLGRWSRRRNMAVIRVGDVKTINCDQSVLKVSRLKWRDDVQSQAMMVDASGIIWLMFHDYMLDTE